MTFLGCPWNSPLSTHAKKFSSSMDRNSDLETWTQKETTLKGKRVLQYQVRPYHVQSMQKIFLKYTNCNCILKTKCANLSNRFLIHTVEVIRVWECSTSTSSITNQGVMLRPCKYTQTVPIKWRIPVHKFSKSLDHRTLLKTYSFYNSKK
jgi:hypothetical protein